MHGPMYIKKSICVLPRVVRGVGNVMIVLRFIYVLGVGVQPWRLP